jgi:small subunit ribosomal protein S20
MAEEKQEKKKAIRIPTAHKRFLQSEKRRLINKAFKAQVRTVVRSFEESLTKKDPTAVKSELDAVYSMMDKGVKRGVYKLNKASRTKSRYAERVQKALA